MSERALRNGRKRILILNSYTLTDRRAEEQVRVRAFLAGLAERGWKVGRDVDVEILDSNDLAELERLLVASMAARPPDVIHAVGTPNAVLAAERAGRTPIVYYGAHPERAGAAACARENIRGVVLTLPFTSSYKRYRFVRKLVPAVRTVYVPFYAGTVFCPEAMREKHERFRRATQRSPWIPGGSELIGYRTLACLHEIVGLEYRELVYRDSSGLEQALTCVDPSRALLMAYNDTVYCPGAPRVLARFCREARMPFLWNNNPEATRIGAVAAIASCFEEAGQVCAGQAARILETGSTAGVESQVATRTFASLDLGRASELGLAPSEEVLAYFDEIITPAAPATAIH